MPTFYVAYFTKLATSAPRYAPPLLRSSAPADYQPSCGSLEMQNVLKGVKVTGAERRIFWSAPPHLRFFKDNIQNFIKVEFFN